MAPWESDAGVSARELGAVDVTRPGRREAFRIRDDVRRLYPPVVAQKGKRTGSLVPASPSRCGYVAHGGSVVIRRQKHAEGGHGPAHLEGTVSCNSAWVCPVCAARILRERSAQVQQAVAWARSNGYHLRLVTSTIRHGAGDDVGWLVRGISEAANRMWAGRDAREFKASLGLVAFIRRIEATYGDFGFHPHVHAIVLSRRRLDGQAWKEWSLRWRREVVRALGFKHRPLLDRGVDFTDVDDRSDYLAKCGLELGDNIVKAPRPGHRSIWSIAEGAGRGKHDDQARWLAWWRGTKGVKLLTWSGVDGAEDPKHRRNGGLKRLVGVRDPDNEDLPETEIVAVLEQEDWKVIRRTRDAVDVLLTVAECGGDVTAAVARIVATARGRPPGVGPPAPCVVQV